MSFFNHGKSIWHDRIGMFLRSPSPTVNVFLTSCAVSSINQLNCICFKISVIIIGNGNSLYICSLMIEIQCQDTWQPRPYFSAVSIKLQRTDLVLAFQDYFMSEVNITYCPLHNTRYTRLVDRKFYTIIWKEWVVIHIACFNWIVKP